MAFSAIDLEVSMVGVDASREAAVQHHLHLLGVNEIPKSPVQAARQGLIQYMEDEEKIETAKVKKQKFSQNRKSWGDPSSHAQGPSICCHLTFLFYRFVPSKQISLELPVDPKRFR